MRTIHKYVLQISASQPVVMPKGAQILTIQTQGHTPCIWALVDPDEVAEMRIIEIYGTGDPIHALPEGKGRKYIGTFQVKDGSVFHAFEYLRSGDTEQIHRGGENG
jgi:hypothetical protein